VSLISSGVLHAEREKRKYTKCCVWTYNTIKMQICTTRLTRCNMDSARWTVKVVFTLCFDARSAESVPACRVDERIGARLRTDWTAEVVIDN
jgi:hypothetical protein